MKGVPSATPVSMTSTMFGWRSRRVISASRSKSATKAGSSASEGRSRFTATGTPAIGPERMVARYTSAIPPFPMSASIAYGARGFASAAISSHLRTDERAVPGLLPDGLEVGVLADPLGRGVPVERGDLEISQRHLLLAAKRVDAGHVVVRVAEVGIDRERLLVPVERAGEVVAH